MINALGRLCDDTAEEGRDEAKGAFETNRMEKEDKTFSISTNEPQKSNVDLSRATWNSVNNRDKMSQIGGRGTPPVPLPIPDPSRPEIMNVGMESLIEYEKKKEKDAEYFKKKINGTATDSDSDVDMDGEICVEPDLSVPRSVRFHFS